ncbi:MAG: hypothetical protein ABFS19_05210 [Thermodesulfobacteriota bacterium]
MTDSIRSHLAGCDTCQHILALDQSLEEKLKGSLEQLEVPRRLQERLDQNMRSNRLQPTRSQLIRRALAPALAMAAMLVIFLLPSGGSFASMDELGNLVIADHDSHADKPCSKEIPKDLATWGEEQIGLRIAAPELPFSDSKLIAASKCKLGDCDAVHLIYSRNGKRFSVFIFPEQEADFSLVAQRNYSVEYAHRRVTIWQSGQQIYAMVG